MIGIPRIAEPELSRSTVHVTGDPWESARLLHRLINFIITTIQRFAGRNHHVQRDGKCSVRSPVEESDSFLNRLKSSVETKPGRGSVASLVVPRSPWWSISRHA